MQITIASGKGYINGVPPEFEDALVAECSFKPVGIEHTWAFKKAMERGDARPGQVKLLRDSKFPPGLLQRIVGFAKKHDIDYAITNQDDTRSKPALTILLRDIDQRDYQDDAVEACALVRRGVVQSPTGSGKTPMAARIIAAKAGHALIVVPTKDLMYQFKRFLDEHMTVIHPTLGVCPIGQLGDGVVDPQPITVATARTASKVVGVAYEPYELGEYDDTDDTDVKRSELRGWVDEIATLLIDECHILGADTVYQLCTSVPAINFFGMSASPWRDDGADLMIEGATGPRIYHIKTKKLVEDGWLVPPLIRTVDTRPWFDGGAWGKICKRCKTQAVTWAQECYRCHGTEFKSQFTECYRKEIVENVRRNAGIAAEVHKLDVPTLVLVKQVKHGRLLKDMIAGSVFLSGKDKSGVRNQAFDDLRSGKVRILIATTIADMGLDVPALTALVLAAGGKSSTRHLQRIGRVVRPYEDKEWAYVVDFDDSHVHQWFASHAKARRKIEQAEWDGVALWI